MNHRSSGLRVSDAIEGFFSTSWRRAEALEVVGCRHDPRKWFIHAGDKDVTQVNALAVQGFLIYLWTDHKPRRFSSELSALAAKIIRSYWKSLSAV